MKAGPRSRLFLVISPRLLFYLTPSTPPDLIPRKISTRMSDNPHQGVRLNKFLASCGIGSRRGCDALVQKGEVTVNGEICVNPGYRVRAEDDVKAGGKRLTSLRVESIILHKPAGLVCSRHDELGKKTVYELLPGRFHHLAHVGRLDLESEGLLILSNDGELTQALTHPRHKVQKVYQVTTENAFENSIIAQLEKGVFCEEIGKCRAHKVRRLSSRRLEIILTTGLKRQIRYMIQAVGHRVKKLNRLQVGPLELGDLPLARWRVLTPAERDLLIRSAS